MKITLAAAIALAAATLSAGAACAQAPNPGSGPGGGDMLAAMDLNHDGVITQEEAKAFREAWFARMDADHDGVVTAAEAQAAIPAGAPISGANFVDRYDTNGDGKVTKEEFLSAPNRLFEFFDANHDGKLDQGELEAARAAIARRGPGG